jgi:hypothetical protein
MEPGQISRYGDRLMEWTAEVRFPAGVRNLSLLQGPGVVLI